MGWETDQPPINYLKRRIIYYKKKRGLYRGMRNDESHYSSFGGKKNYHRLIDKRIFWIEQRIKEYEEAIKILENGTRRDQKTKK